MPFEYALMKEEKAILRVRSVYAPDEVSAVASGAGLTNDAAVAVFRLLGTMGEGYSLRFIEEYYAQGFGNCGVYKGEGGK